MADANSQLSILNCLGELKVLNSQLPPDMLRRRRYTAGNPTMECNAIVGIDKARQINIEDVAYLKKNEHGIMHVIN